MVLESKGIDSDTETLRVFHGRDVIFNQSACIGKQRREAVGNQLRVEVECQNISNGDDNSQEATGPQRLPRIRKALDLYREWVYVALRLSDPGNFDRLPSPETRHTRPNSRSRTTASLNI